MPNLDQSKIYFRDCRSNFNKSEETKRIFVTPMITGSQKREVCFWHRRIRPPRLLARILSLTFIFLNFWKRNNPKILGKQAGAIRIQWNYLFCSRYKYRLIFNCSTEFPNITPFSNFFLFVLSISFFVFKFL